MNRNSVLSDPGPDSPRTSPVIMARVAQHHRRQGSDALVPPSGDQVSDQSHRALLLSLFSELGYPYVALNDQTKPCFEIDTRGQIVKGEHGLNAYMEVRLSQFLGEESVNASVGK